MNNKTAIIILSVGVLILILVGIYATAQKTKVLENTQGVVDPPVTLKEENTNDKTQIVATAMFGGGCFWCVESDLQKVKGVYTAVSGYAGGTGENPIYENYSAGGFREVVQVTYDPSIVSYGNLVEHIIKHGDPTDANGSFGDRGEQYAPAIYYSSDAEKQSAQRVIQAIDTMKVYPTALTIVVIPSVQFWKAEEYHQDYGVKNSVRYNFYRTASGRDSFIKKYWGNKAGEFTASAQLQATTAPTIQVANTKKMNIWESYKKPGDDELKILLTDIQFEVTQREGTEKSFKNEYDTNKAEGIYVDILSGEPLYSSRDKFDSGTGWPSFVKTISPNSVVTKEDKGFFGTRIEVRSRIADSHLGHVFDDGPTDRGGKRFCMNSAALRFVPKENMVKEGYGDYLSSL